MADELNVEAMITRFRERAEAVRNRPLPPVGGEERALFIRRAQGGFPGFRHHRRCHRRHRGRHSGPSGGPAPARRFLIEEHGR